MRRVWPVLLLLALAHRAPAAPDEEGVQWLPLLKESFFFLSLEHGFRVATESDTRAGLGGPFFKGWMQSAANLHGWADGDPFYVNYLGHPLQGAVSGFLLVHNDPKYRRAEFGRNRDYWRSRVRAAGWAWAYSTQFEIGPFSEASIGKVQSHFPQQGLVDHVITPTIGMAWMVAEDALDRYVIRNIESRTNNRLLRVLARGVLNPSRSMSNMLAGELPWRRDTREGWFTAPAEKAATDEVGPMEREPYRNDHAWAPFELTVQYLYTGAGSSQSCNGGGGTALFNLSRHFGIEGEVSGCKTLESGTNVSGDSTVYTIGPRYTFRDSGRWSPYLHALAGGEKVTTETLYPNLKSAIPTALSRIDADELHALYTSQSQTNGLALRFGAGVEYALNRALAWRIAGLDYTYTRAGDSRPGNDVRFTTGVVLRMGTW